jgi:hypothetical protein
MGTTCVTHYTPLDFIILIHFIRGLYQYRDYTASVGRLTDELGRIWKEVVVA